LILHIEGYNDHELQSVCVFVVHVYPIMVTKCSTKMAISKYLLWHFFGPEETAYKSYIVMFFWKCKNAESFLWWNV